MRLVRHSAWKEARRTIPFVDKYKPLSDWSDLWMPNLFNTEEGYYDGSINRLP
ncbi:MAG: hypothetical protein ACJARD_001692 [Alphaproteobacteria bacterium]|jgi:hypothetical protein